MKHSLNTVAPELRRSNAQSSFEDRLAICDAEPRCDVDPEMSAMSSSIKALMDIDFQDYHIAQVLLYITIEIINVKTKGLMTNGLVCL